MSFSLNNFNNFIDSNGENIKKSFIKEQKKIIFENIENHSSKKKN